MNLETLTLAIIGVISLLVLLVVKLTDAAIKILSELEKLREAWRRFRQTGGEDGEAQAEELPR
ncbi:hypothetical protein [Streptomyces sp. NPDC015414]|uniref:hypothetical protein n=1 Tax=Streptomyces sp. NPDC015414 TaxID=3364957 RepID=UPI0036F6B2FB